MAPGSDAGYLSDPEKTTTSQDKPRGDSVNHDDSTVSRKDGEEKADHTEEEAPSAPLSPMHEIAFISVICMAQFLALAGLAQTIAPLNIIGR